MSYPSYPPTYPPTYPPHGNLPPTCPPQYPPQTYPPQTYPPQTYPPQTYPPQTYPPQTYPPQTYPPQTYPPQTYPPQTLPPTYPPTYPPTSVQRGCQLPDSAHEHGLTYERTNAYCKVCNMSCQGDAYVCHQCPLILCWECANAIFYGNKAKQIHRHYLSLRVRNAWRCDVCGNRYRGTASFYCRPCDFDACSRCYVGF